MRRHRLVDNLFFPLIYLLNRPALDKFHRLVLLFAYRISGMGVSWSSSSSLTVGGSLFLRRSAGFIADGTVIDVGVIAARRDISPDEMALRQGNRVPRTSSADGPTPAGEDSRKGN